ncbi:hypothetical protein DFR65_101108 [Oceanihabitans sediminis]|uniref:Uncharacterized protein n=1 Tax=Oceanihabitans sediminis TaxID=1812012 RepID=A0A368P7N4_9FLAO|nr:hypothetical protein [Oceanihabitans sediminis]RBP34225.1 hypothetical protein DFR65_101108 [Oceanihabitans sediminis]RCU57915.1 hypothetical protein DU428_00535 [Oceanihabitans sediminis]
MDTKYVNRIIESTKKINDYKEVITAFQLDFTAFNQDYRAEVISEFENLIEEEKVRLKAIYILQKQKALLEKKGKNE